MRSRPNLLLLRFALLWRLAKRAPRRAWRALAAPSRVAAAAEPAHLLPPALRTEIFADADSLRRLRPIWDELMERTRLDHPFLTHDWISSWWDAFGSGRELRVIAVFSGTTCIAIAPLMLGTTRVCGIAVRSLELVGNEHTPRSGFIVAERSDVVFRAILEALHGLGRRWEVLVLSQLAAGSQTEAELQRLAKQAGILTGIWRAPPSPRMELRGSWSEYLKSLKAKQRTNLRNRLNRLRRVGPIELEEICGGAQLEAALDDGVRIEGAAWKSAAETAIGSRPEPNRFYRRFAESAARRGWLSLHFLKVGGKRVAFSYGLRFRNTLYLVKQGYDPAYAAASPSQVLCALMFEEAFKRGESALDFLGIDEPWKREWTSESQANSWLYLFQPGLRARPLHFAKFHLLPAVRSRLPDAWSSKPEREAKRETG